MSALAKNETDNLENSVTTINANARIDYIFRFSKHVAAIIDDNNEGYGEVASQFLSELPDNHNAAYLALSPKLNDIQIRCRLVEQLFIGVPFDPEQSLANNIIELMDQHKTPISIVVEHCQFISLQILHELCQLADTAKKTKRVINIVLTGQIPMGKLIATNPILFANKVSMISAQTGQLISPKAEMFKESGSTFSFTGYKRFLLGLVVLLLAGAAIIYTLYQRDNMAFSGIVSNAQSDSEIASDKFVDMSSVPTASSNSNSIISESSVISEPNEVTNNAESVDILNAIINVSEIQTTPKEPMLATPEEIAIELALTVADYPVVPSSNNFIEASTQQQDNQVIADELTANQVSDEFIMPISYEDYFASLDFGYVLQYVTLSYADEANIPNLVTEYTTQHEDVTFKHYRRVVNGKNVVVITSDFYTDRASALTELRTLPSSLASSGAWIKPISAIKEEIALFKSSQ